MKYQRSKNSDRKDFGIRALLFSAKKGTKFLLQALICYSLISLFKIKTWVNTCFKREICKKEICKKESWKIWILVTKRYFQIHISLQPVVYQTMNSFRSNSLNKFEISNVFTPPYCKKFCKKVQIIMWTYWSEDLCQISFIPWENVAVWSPCISETMSKSVPTLAESARHGWSNLLKFFFIKLQNWP